MSVFMNLFCASSVIMLYGTKKLNPVYSGVYAWQPSAILTPQTCLAVIWKVSGKLSTEKWL